jgi:hypothetical protein
MDQMLIAGNDWLKQEYYVQICRRNTDELLAELMLEMAIHPRQPSADFGALRADAVDKAENWLLRQQPHSPATRALLAGDAYSAAIAND